MVEAARIELASALAEQTPLCMLRVPCMRSATDMWHAELSVQSYAR